MNIDFAKIKIVKILFFEEWVELNDYMKFDNHALLAQLVAHETCNPEVKGSSPLGSFKFFPKGKGNENG